MSKAVIVAGGKQYIVSEGDTLHVELQETDNGKTSFDALMLIDGNNVTVGAPSVQGVAVSADVLDIIRADKVTSIRYKAKKRVHKLRGHRQQLQTIKITKIG